MNSNLLNYIKKDLVYAIIPARSGSKGVKNKNIRMLNGFPMIAYTIAAAKLSEKINRIIVSTDSEEYAEIAVKFGAETPFIRPAEISGDRSADIEFMEHAINWLGSNEKLLPEFWVHLRPTNPLRDFNIINDAVNALMNDNSADSLRSAHIANVSPFKWFLLDKKGYYKTFGGMTLDDANRPRQDFPDVYIPDGYVDVLRSSYIINNDLMHGKKMIGFRSPESVDVDNLSDFDELERIIKDYRSDVTEYLNNMKRVEL